MFVLRTPESQLILIPIPSLILPLGVRVDQGVRLGDEVQISDVYIS